jgi:hypothetical protein
MLKCIKCFINLRKSKNALIQIKNLFIVENCVIFFFNFQIFKFENCFDLKYVLTLKILQFEKCSYLKIIQN